MPNDEEGEGIPPDPDPESAWDSLPELVKNAEHSAELAPLVDLLLPLRPVDRESVAQIIGPLIQFTEWPASWVKPRDELVRALETIVPLLDTNSPKLAVSQFNHTHQTALIVGRAVLRLVAHLLAVPFPPGQLRWLAALCNLGFVVFSGTDLKTLTRPGVTPSPSFESARAELGAALFRYGEAAHALNDACGEVLFHSVISEP